MLGMSCVYHQIRHKRLSSHTLYMVCRTCPGSVSGTWAGKNIIPPCRDSCCCRDEAELPSKNTLPASRAATLLSYSVLTHPPLMLDEIICTHTEGDRECTVCESHFRRTALRLLSTPVTSVAFNPAQVKPNQDIDNLGGRVHLPLDEIFGSLISTDDVAQVVTMGFNRFKLLWARNKKLMDARRPKCTSHNW